MERVAERGKLGFDGIGVVAGLDDLSSDGMKAARLPGEERADCCRALGNARRAAHCADCPRHDVPILAGKPLQRPCQGTARPIRAYVARQHRGLAMPMPGNWSDVRAPAHRSMAWRLPPSRHHGGGSALARPRGRDLSMTSEPGASSCPAACRRAPFRGSGDDRHMARWHESLSTTGGSMGERQKPDAGTCVDAAAQVIDLPIDPQYRDAVIANFERARQIASLALAGALPDELESAPVFRP
jgi:hypothetical protein